MRDSHPLVYAMAQWSIKVEGDRYYISPTPFFEKKATWGKAYKTL